MFSDSYLSKLLTCILWIILFMCTSDTLTSHFSTACANAYVCNGPCTNTTWNYILPLFPFLTYYLSEERIIVICGLQSLIFIKANWNSLVFRSYQEKNSYTASYWRSACLCLEVLFFPVTLVGLANAITFQCYHSPPKGARFKQEKYCI